MEGNYGVWGGNEENWSFILSFFYHEEKYLDRLIKWLQKFQEIMSQVPTNLRNIVELESFEWDNVLEVNEEEEQTETLSWAKGGRNKKKLIEIP